MPWIGGAIAGLGSLAGAGIGASTAASAAGTQAQAQEAAIAAQLAVLQQIQQQLGPYRQTGANSLGALGGLLGVQDTPGWQTGWLQETPQQVAGIPNAP